MKDQRDIFWDVVKGVAILLVVLGHSMLYASGADYLRSNDFYDNYLLQFITSFHMPIFMVVSGYLFYNSISRRSASTIIQSRLKMLITPVLSFAFIYKFPIFLSVFTGESSFLFFVYDFLTFSFLGYHLWFLWSIFINTIFVIIVEKLRLPRYTYFFIWICLIMIPSDILYAPYSFMFPYFIIGLFLHEYEKKIRWSNDKRILIISALIYLTLLFFYDRETFVYVSGQDILRENGFHYLLLDVQRFLTGIFGSLFVINALRIIYERFKEHKLITYLSFLGKNSMGIYCFHHIFFWQYILRITRRIHLDYCSPSLTLLAFIGALVFSLVATYISKKFKLTRILFLGGR